MSIYSPSLKWNEITSKPYMPKTKTKADETQVVPSAEELEKGAEENAVEVPEIETNVVDLPPEDENEKEIVVEDQIPEPEVIDPVEPEENRVSAEEVGDDPTHYPSDEELAGIPDTDSNPDATQSLKNDEQPKAEGKGEEKKKDEEPKEMSDEEALKEAQELAQDELTGFKVSGKNWSKMTDKQKADAIKAFKDANKVEDHSQTVNEDNSETNNFQAYERYPTWLKAGELGGRAIHTAIDETKDVAQKVGEQGKNSGSIANEVTRAIPHFDYRSLFR